MGNIHFNLIIFELVSVASLLAEPALNYKFPIVIVG
jgi:hypothetical protein